MNCMYKSNKLENTLIFMQRHCTIFHMHYNKDVIKLRTAPHCGKHCDETTDRDDKIDFKVSYKGLNSVKYQ